jgi:hypothetical protein
MSTFRTWAEQEQQGVVDQCTVILHMVRDEKKNVKDNEALKILSNVQAQMLALRTQAGAALTHLHTAARNNELRELVPVPDRKSQAAGDDTLDFMRS